MLLAAMILLILWALGRAGYAPAFHQIPPFGLSLSKASLAIYGSREGMGFDNGQVRIAPSNPQPSRGLGGLTISPNGGGVAIRLCSRQAQKAFADAGFL